MRIAKRTICIGVVVWLLFFGWWFKGYLYINWRFELFSFSSWRFVFNEFRSGWRLSNIGDWIFLISFILAGPVFCLFWYLANKVFWLSFVKRGYHYTKRGVKRIYRRAPERALENGPKAAPVVAQNPSLQRPAKMTQTGGGFGLMQMPKSQPFQLEQAQAQWQKEHPPEKQSLSSQEGPPFNAEGDFKEMAEIPLSEVELPQIESVNEDISAELTHAGYRPLMNVKVGDKKVDWLGVADNQLWVAFYDEETGDWLADEEAFNEENPLWFSETDHRVSPVFELKQLQKQMAEKIGDDAVQIHPVLIERRGNLINAEDMLKTWNDLGVVVCRTEVGGPVELPTVAEVLKDPQTPARPEFLTKINELFNCGEKVNG